MSAERAILVLGPSESTNLATIGCLLNKFGAVNLMMMERFEKAGHMKYGDAAKDIKEHEGWQFETPKHRGVKIKESGEGKVDVALYVVPANEEANSSDAATAQKTFQDATSQAREVIVLVVFTAEDDTWSEEQFKTCVDRLGVNPNDIPTIPISTERGENFTGWDTTPKLGWYKGWKKVGEAGKGGLLEALDALL